MELRRETEHIKKNYRAYLRDYGEVISWYEFRPFGDNIVTDSTFSDLYEEGPVMYGGRMYENPTTIPVMMVTESEDQKRAIPEGRQPLQIINLVTSLEAFRKAGVSNPHEYQPRLNDMFSYDGRYYSVMAYRVRGRTRDDLLVVVEGEEVYVDQEMPWDVGPEVFSVSDLPWPERLPS